MASRPEIVAICKELELEYKNKTTKEMHDIVREELDRRFGNPKNWNSTKGLSEDLIRFMTTEYHYVIRNRKEFGR